MSTKMIKKLKLKESIMKIDKIPIVNEKTILKEALEEMNKYEIGISCVVNKQGKLIGIITDGDIRRKILKIQKPFSALLNDDVIRHMTKNPKVVKINLGLLKSLKIMQKRKIWDLPVLDNKKKLLGLLHFNSVIKTLISKKYFN